MYFLRMNKLPGKLLALFYTILVLVGALILLKPAFAAGEPAAPAGLTATAGNQNVTLSWDSVDGATGYKVYMGTATGVYDLEPPQVTTGATACTAIGLTNNTTYHFAVTAVNGAGESAKSADVSATW